MLALLRALGAERITSFTSSVGFMQWRRYLHKIMCCRMGGVG